LSSRFIDPRTYVYRTFLTNHSKLSARMMYSEEMLESLYSVLASAKSMFEMSMRGIAKREWEKARREFSECVLKYGKRIMSEIEKSPPQVQSTFIAAMDAGDIEEFKRRLSELTQGLAGLLNDAESYSDLYPPVVILRLKETLNSLSGSPGAYEVARTYLWGGFMNCILSALTSAVSELMKYRAVSMNVLTEEGEGTGSEDATGLSDLDLEGSGVDNDNNADKGEQDA